MTTTETPNLPLSERCLYPRLDCNGNLAYTPFLTHASRTDPVDIVIGKLQVLPIVFVPGIMGSNLKVKGTNTEAWRFDSVMEIGPAQAIRTAGERQKILHPDRTEIDPQGDVPDKVGILIKPEHFRQRGWGEISAASYQDLLIWMEETFHGQRGQGIGPSSHAQLNTRLRGIADGLRWRNTNFVPLTEEECLKAEGWSYPVYAFGYNWLQSNEHSAKYLAARIKKIIAACNTEHGRCEQVIVVTHSMGGLVARRCAQLPDMASRIAGVVHGVMPAIGAAVTYRRCKVGMWDEDWKASLVIGHNGQEVTAVFAQSPGALELLPNDGYRTNWLEFSFGGNEPRVGVSVDGDYHQVVFRARENWWGLIKEKWLKPQNGSPIEWSTYLKAMKMATDFHMKIRKSYHTNSWAFYGVGVPSFESVRWKREEGTVRYLGVMDAPPTDQEILDATGHDPTVDKNGVLHHMPKQVFQSGSNPATMYGSYVDRHRQGNGAAPVATTQSIYFYLRAMPPKDDGDGTVPIGSGRAPEPFVRQIFAIKGLHHEPAYQSKEARDITAYAIVKIAAQTVSCLNTSNGQNGKAIF